MKIIVIFCLIFSEYAFSAPKELRLAEDAKTLVITPEHVPIGGRLQINSMPTLKKILFEAEGHSFTNLIHLVIFDNVALENLIIHSDLFSSLKELDLNQNPSLEFLAVLGKRPALKSIHLTQNVHLKNLIIAPIVMEKLHSFHLLDSSLTELVIPEVNILRNFHVQKNHDLKRLSLPKGMNNLKEFVVEDNDSLSSLSIPGGMPSLLSLRINKNNELKTLKLEGPSTIRDLDISDNINLESFLIPRDWHLTITHVCGNKTGSRC